MMMVYNVDDNVDHNHRYLGHVDMVRLVNANIAEASKQSITGKRMGYIDNDGWIDIDSYI